MNTSITAQRHPFWFLEDGLWSLMISHSVFSPEEYRKLPSIPKSSEWRLQDSKINYEVAGDYCLIFDPTCVEYEDYTAPEYGTAGLREHTDKVRTERMVSAAEQYYDASMQRLHEQDVAFEKESFDRNFARDSKDGISYCWTQDYDDFNTLTPEQLADKYVLFKVGGQVNYEYLMGFCDYLVILKSAVKPGQALTIKVPTDWAGKVIGKGGARVKELTQLLGVRFVKVEPVNRFED